MQDYAPMRTLSPPIPGVAQNVYGKTVITTPGRKYRKPGHKGLYLEDRENPLTAGLNTCAQTVILRLTHHGEFVLINEVADTAGLCNEWKSGSQQ
jgi:hypothetical protein